MDILLVILGTILILVGLVGCILPIIPGPPLSFLGILMMHFTSRIQYEKNFLLMWFVIVVAVTILDYLIPIWGTKKFGGTKRGVWGATLGLIVGLFFGPIGIIVGPFVGAVIGELTKSEDMNKAIKSGIGSLVGFLFGSVFKFIVSGFLLFYFFKEFKNLF